MFTCSCTLPSPALPDLVTLSTWHLAPPHPPLVTTHQTEAIKVKLEHSKAQWEMSNYRDEVTELIYISFDGTSTGTVVPKVPVGVL